MTNRQQSAFFLAIVFLFTCGAGLLIYKQYDEYFSQKAEMDLEVASTSQPVFKKPVSPSATSTPEQVLGWNTYKNDQYGFEFSYPKNWDFSNGSIKQTPELKSDGTWSYNPFVIVGNPLSGTAVYIFTLSVAANPKGLTAEQYVKNMVADAPKDGPGGIKFDRAFSLTVNGNQAYELYNVFSYDENDEQIYFANQSLIFRLSFPVADINPNLANPKDNNLVAHQILSSFKIIP